MPLLSGLSVKPKLSRTDFRTSGVMKGVDGFFYVVRVFITAQY
jgi:hypothetical protein